MSPGWSRNDRNTRVWYRCDSTELPNRVAASKIGSLTGSWEGVPKEVVIANWNGGKKRPSLGFFVDRGHRQILAGYYAALTNSLWFHLLGRQACLRRPARRGVLWHTTWAS